MFAILIRDYRHELTVIIKYIISFCYIVALHCITSSVDKIIDKLANKCKRMRFE